MIRTILPLFISAAFVPALPAQAGVVTFVDRATFNHASGPLQIESFAHCSRRTTAITGPIMGAQGCGGGAIAPGLRISDDGAANNQALFLAAPHFGANHGYAVGQNSPASDALELDFTGGTRAVGFDVYQNFGGGAQLGRAAKFTINVYSDLALDGAFAVRVPSGGKAFFGAVGISKAITRVTVDNPLAYDMVGDVAFSLPRKAWGALTFAAPFSTPEPAAFALLGLGAAGLALARRR